MSAQHRKMIPSPAPLMLTGKEGFFSLEQLFRQQEDFLGDCARFEGQLVLVEMNYLVRTCFGGPGTGDFPREAAGFLLGVIDSTLRKDYTIPHVFVPVGKHLWWERGTFGDFIEHNKPLHLDVMHACFAYKGKAFSRIFLGNASVEGFIQEAGKDAIRGGSQFSLMFWKAAEQLGVDISSCECISGALAEKRKKALITYVEKKISAPSRVKRDLDGIVSAPIEDSFLDRELLWLGLTKEEIKKQAREMILVKLDL